MVFVEGIQSSVPIRDHAAWLRGLEKVCRDSGVLFGVDETICGNRVEFGGAHVHFGLEPDIVTYGKSLGGGMPIGAVCGRRELLEGFGVSPERRPKIAGV